MALPISLLASTCAVAQPKFDVASVKIVPMPTEGQPVSVDMERVTVHPGSVSMPFVRLRAAIKWAYDLKEYQLAGPSWLGSTGWLGRDVARYAILAKASEGTPVPEMRAMMRTLLAERFGLVAHREAREMAAYSLVPISGNAAPGLHLSEDQMGDRRGEAQGSKLVFRSTTVAEFAEFLSGPVGSPVLDLTGLKGRYDITFDFARYREEQGSERADRLAIFARAIQSDLGWKLEPRKSAIDTLVIDRLEKTPKEN